MVSASVLLLVAVAIACCGALPAFRPPAVPLFTMDPYMQVYSAADTLVGTPTTYWGGAARQFVGLARVNGTTYVWCGVPLWTTRATPAKQLKSVVLPTSTVVNFALGAGATLKVVFYNPLFIADNDTSAGNPSVGYVQLVPSVPMDLYFASTAELATNKVSETVLVEQVDAQTARVGTVAQNVLGLAGDNVGINWGHLYLGVSARVSNARVLAGNLTAAEADFQFTGSVPTAVPSPQPQRVDDNWPGVAVSWTGAAAGSSNVAAIGYDDIAPIDFFGVPLKPLWTRTYASFTDLLRSSIAQFAPTTMACAAVDARILQDASQAGGTKHEAMSALAYRQTMAGLKFVVSPANTRWVFMKEISSDGDISTVDVVFPASPLFLLYNPQLLADMLMPLFVFAANQTAMPTHNYTKPWAPHHLGVWPIADATADNQEDMPVEESGNMILMVAAIAKRQGSFPPTLLPYIPLLMQWAKYLQSVLPDPGNQLCTDDFTGKSPNNVNLAAKGIVALRAIADFPSVAPLGPYFRQVADAYATYWLAEAADGDHFELEYRLPGTWSTKYNLLFQEILGLDVFPQSVLGAERAFYIASHLNKYGVPLDNRADFTKIDWMNWMFAGASPAQFRVISDALFAFFNTTGSRIPMTDWSYTSTPMAVGPFRARPVMGGVFARQLLQLV